ncbi:MAG TPA: NAD(P) transhydrogenase subunit alpha [Gemmatimonadaceae bacterium]
MTEELIVGIVIFTLATFLGAALIGRVPPTLHTPLMSGANAISGITIAGALIVAGADYGWISTVLGFLAIVFAMMNVAGGYAVTDRMLAMFRKKEEPQAAAATPAASAAPSGGRS